MEFKMTLCQYDLEILIMENIRKKFPDANITIKWSSDDYICAYVDAEANS